MSLKIFKNAILSHKNRKIVAKNTKNRDGIGIE